jgi:hypothetical protein
MIVKITLLDLEDRGQPAQLTIPGLNLAAPVLCQNGQRGRLTFTASRTGTCR